MKKQKDGAVVDGRTKIHNVRFYNLTPRAIQCMAYNKFNHKLAVSRNDGSIEIWDMQHGPYLEKTIPKTPGDSVEGLVWAGLERLFSVGLSDELIEWNLQTLQPRYSQHVTGNSIWCIDMNGSGTELAIGTEEGYINIFDITNDQLQYKNLLDKQEGRVLCCKYDATGKYLVTGSLGAIRIWCVQSGHALHRMKLSGASKKKETIVWSLQVLKDFTIISGDSRGCVTIWDGRTATEIESLQALKADVLTVAVNEEENLLMCSGIDPIIRIYAKTQIKREDMIFNRWVRFLQRSVHDHDVKTLICAGERIISGGMDGYLGLSLTTKTTSTISKYGPFLQSPCASVAPLDRLLLLRYPNYLEVWRLGSTSNKPDTQINNCNETGDSDLNSNDDQQLQKHNENLLALNAQPEKILELKSKNERRIQCATLSPNGQWLCYSTPNEIRLFKLVVGIAGQTAAQLMRINNLPEQCCVASHLQFNADSSRLFLVSQATRQILIFNMLTNGGSDLDFNASIETDEHIKDSIHLFNLSQCGDFMAVAAVNGTIAVWNVFKGKYFKHLLNLPHYPSMTTALAIDGAERRLIATFSDGKIFEYDLEEMCFTCSDHNTFVSSRHCITSIVLDPRNPNVLILHNDATMFVLEKCYSVNDHSMINGNGHADDDNSETTMMSEKKTKRMSDMGKHILCGLRLKMEKTFEHFISLEWLSANELVAVGVNPVSMIEQLPGAFKQKKFGAA